MQSKKGSFIEACINTLIGFLISLAANPLFCWLFHVKMNNKQMFSYIAAFTVLSVLRSYIIRRFFNGVVHRAVQRTLKNYGLDAEPLVLPKFDYTNPEELRKFKQSEQR